MPKNNESLASKVLNVEYLHAGSLPVYDKAFVESVYVMGEGFENVLEITKPRRFIVPMSEVEQTSVPVQNSDVGFVSGTNQATKEDAALFALLNSARVWGDSPSRTTSGYFTKSSFSDALATLEKQDLIAQNVLLPTRLLKDFENEFPGVLVKTSEFSSGVTHEGQVMGVTVYVHAEMPPSRVYVLPAPEFLGLFVINAEDEEGVNELEIGMAISNPNGVVTLNIGFPVIKKG